MLKFKKNIKGCILLMICIGLLSVLLTGCSNTDNYTSEDKYLEVIDTYVEKTRSKNLATKTHSTHTHYYLVIDVEGSRRDISVPKGIFNQVIKGNSINCRVYKDENNTLKKVDILVSK